MFGIKLFSSKPKLSVKLPQEPTRLPKEQGGLRLVEAQELTQKILREEGGIVAIKLEPLGLLIDIERKAKLFYKLLLQEGMPRPYPEKGKPWLSMYQNGYDGGQDDTALHMYKGVDRKLCLEGLSTTFNTESFRETLSFERPLPINQFVAQSLKVGSNEQEEEIMYKHADGTKATFFLPSWFFKIRTAEMFFGNAVKFYNKENANGFYPWSLVIEFIK